VVPLEYSLEGKVNVKGELSLGSATFTLSAAVTQSVGAGAGVVLPDGIYYVFCGANTKVQVNDGTAWQDFTAAGGIALVISDGVNVRLYNSGTQAESSKLRKIA
jgi:hypothetical protein